MHLHLHNRDPAVLVHAPPSQPHQRHNSTSTSNTRHEDTHPSPTLTLHSTRKPNSPRDKKEEKEDVARAEYLAKLAVPTLAEIESIAHVQERKEEEVEARYNASAGTQQRAAGTIQRTYRGHRERRQMNGLSLDPSTRWIEAIQEATYRNLTTPRARTSIESMGKGEGDAQRRRSDAHSNWQRVSGIARRAHGESDSAAQDSSSSSDESVNSPVDKAVRAFHRRQEKKEKEAWKGKAMDLPYFLEMVDLKHRYGSNLRAYHAEWKKAKTHENYFYWLDYGEGREVELPMCSRERLEREQVRYLSREERMQYLVDVDPEGRLRWRKNGERIDTTAEFRDSMVGIVPKSDTAKTYREDELAALQRKYHGEPQQAHSSGSESSESSDEEDEDKTGSGEDGKRYPDPEGLKNAKGPRKIGHVTPAAILNRLMRKSVKKNTWIFVADTAMNLYVGIKQSGSFQHSSFLHGSRISSAGLIKIKRGQLRSLSPLSGHYRPPTSAFRHLIAHLKEQNVDMGRVSISKSYAVLIGLEAYMREKQRVHKAGEKIKKGGQWVVHPDEARRRRETERDQSESARLEEEKLRENEGQTMLAKLKEKKHRVGDRWADVEAARKGNSRPATGGPAGGDGGEGAGGVGGGFDGAENTVPALPKLEEETTGEGPSAELPLRGKANGVVLAPETG